MRDLTDVIKVVEANHVSQVNAMQNRLITMERSQSQVPRFPPRANQEWKNSFPPQDQRPPNQLEATNMVNDEAPPFCRDFEEFHEEATFPVFCQINEHRPPETNNVAILVVLIS